MADLKPEGVDAAVSQVRARGAQVLGFALNVTERDDLDPVAAGVKEPFGRIDVLVNYAGIAQGARLQKMPLEQSDAVIDLNLRGAFHATQAVLPTRVAPGFVETPILATLPDKVLQQMREQVPLNRLGRPEAIANTCAYLAGDEASCSNGAVIEVSGGMTV